MIATTVSLIISTYNWPKALSIVLKSALTQKRLPDEIIIADDGSTQETADCINKIRENSPIPIIHAWQDDNGFRAARSRNNGVKNSSGDYLIFVDGDTVLHKKFISDHLILAEKNTFTVGSRVLLQEQNTLKYTTSQCFNFNWFSNSKNKLNALNCLFLAKQLGKKQKAPIEQLIFKVRSCNMAVWRNDFLDVNGFNHDFCGWGREDSEFALRLFKKGLSLKRLKFSAIQFHLYHKENDRSELDNNDVILKNTFDNDSFQCENGFFELGK